MNHDVTQRAKAIDAAAAELKASVDELIGMGPADELAILVGALQRVSSKLAKRAEELESTVPSFAAEGPGERPPAPPLAPAARRAESASPAAVDALPTGLRIVATDLAASGSTREEVHTYLQERFGVPDPAALLDEVFATDGAGR